MVTIKVKRCEECPLSIEDSMVDDYSCYSGGTPNNRSIFHNDSGVKLYNELVPKDCPLKIGNINITLEENTQ